MGNSIIDNAVAAGSTISTLPAGDWDLVSAVGNATNYGKLLGGGIIGLLGVILLIVATVFIFKKLTGNGQGNEKSWVIIVVMILIGGAMSFGGYTLISQVASGGQKTVQELGGGFIVLKSVLWLVH